MLKGNPVWAFTRMVALATAAWIIGSHESVPVAAACASSCTTGQQDPNGNCTKGASCNSVSKGSSGNSCSASGCTCTWSGSCTGS